MAQKTREELNAANAALFVNNETGDITPDEERAYNEDVNDSFAIRYEFDVTITDTAAIQALNSAPITLVEDDGVSYLQLIAATILMNNDGTTPYDFTGYMSIIGTVESNVKAFSASMDVSIASGTTSITTLPVNLPSTNNLFLTFKVAENSGGLALSAFSDATEGDYSLRVYGTYTKFPIS
jgi:hypothetical protein